jgi:hypothetical protein
MEQQLTTPHGTLIVSNADTGVASLGAGDINVVDAQRSLAAGQPLLQNVPLWDWNTGQPTGQTFSGSITVNTNNGPVELSPDLFANGDVRLNVNQGTGALQVYVFNPSALPAGVQAIPNGLGGVGDTGGGYQGNHIYVPGSGSTLPAGAFNTSVYDLDSGQVVRQENIKLSTPSGDGTLSLDPSSLDRITQRYPGQSGSFYQILTPNGAYTVEQLTQAGYNVILPGQSGFNDDMSNHVAIRNAAGEIIAKVPVNVENPTPNDPFKVEITVTPHTPTPTPVLTPTPVPPTQTPTPVPTPTPAETPVPTPTQKPVPSQDLDVIQVPAPTPPLDSSTSMDSRSFTTSSSTRIRRSEAFRNETTVERVVAESLEVKPFGDGGTQFVASQTVQSSSTTEEGERNYSFDGSSYLSTSESTYIVQTGTLDTGSPYTVTTEDSVPPRGYDRSTGGTWNNITPLSTDVQRYSSSRVLQDGNTPLVNFRENGYEVNSEAFNPQADNRFLDDYRFDALEQQELTSILRGGTRIIRETNGQVVTETSAFNRGFHARRDWRNAQGPDTVRTETFTPATPAMDPELVAVPNAAVFIRDGSTWTPTNVGVTVHSNGVLIDGGSSFSTADVSRVNVTFPAGTQLPSGSIDIVAASQIPGFQTELGLTPRQLATIKGYPETDDGLDQFFRDLKGNQVPGLQTGIPQQGIYYGMISNPSDSALSETERRLLAQYQLEHANYTTGSLQYKYEEIPGQPGQYRVVIKNSESEEDNTREMSERETGMTTTVDREETTVTRVQRHGDIVPVFRVNSKREEIPSMAVRQPGFNTQLIDQGFAFRGSLGPALQEGGVAITGQATLDYGLNGNPEEGKLNTQQLQLTVNANPFGPDIQRSGWLNGTLSYNQAFSDSSTPTVGRAGVDFVFGSQQAVTTHTATIVNQRDGAEIYRQSATEIDEDRGNVAITPWVGIEQTLGGDSTQGNIGARLGYTVAGGSGFIGNLYGNVRQELNRNGTLYVGIEGGITTALSSVPDEADADDIQFALTVGGNTQGDQQPLQADPFYESANGLGAEIAAGRQAVALTITHPNDPTGFVSNAPSFAHMTDGASRTVYVDGRLVPELDEYIGGGAMQLVTPGGESYVFAIPPFAYQGSDPRPIIEGVLRDIERNPAQYQIVNHGRGNYVNLAATQANLERLMEESLSQQLNRPVDVQVQAGASVEGLKASLDAEVQRIGAERLIELRAKFERGEINIGDPRVLDAGQVSSIRIVVDPQFNNLGQALVPPNSPSGLNADGSLGDRSPWHHNPILGQTTDGRATVTSPFTGQPIAIDTDVPSLLNWFRANPGALNQSTVGDPKSGVPSRPVPVPPPAAGAPVDNQGFGNRTTSPNSQGDESLRPGLQETRDGAANNVVPFSSQPVLPGTRQQ